MSVFASGTQLAVINTEHTLSGADITTAGSYILKVNLTPMLTNDVVELRVKDKVISAGALVGYIKETFSNAQNADVCAVASIPFRTEIASRCTLKQTAGTGRTYEWSINRIDS